MAGCCITTIYFQAMGSHALPVILATSLFLCHYLFQKQVKKSVCRLTSIWRGIQNLTGMVPNPNSGLCLGDFGPDFFNTNMADLVIKLKNHSSYPALFKQAFNVNDVSKLTHDELKLNIVYSISQFMRTMISSDSKFDKMIKHKATLTFEEKDGYETFFSERGDCFHCHDAPLFTSNTFNNNGLDSVLTEADLGRFLVTGINRQRKI